MQEYQYLENVVANMILDEQEWSHDNSIYYVSKTLSLLNYSESDIRKVILGVYLRDIGLHLTTEGEEYEFHPIKGLVYIGTSDELEIVKNVVLLHHENYIGTGFPYELRGHQVPEYVQVVSICITYVQLREIRKSSESETISKLYELYNKDLVEFIQKNVLKKIDIRAINS